MSSHLEEQFTDIEQQRESYKMGMWIFLASELMLFSALFLAYTVGRLSHYRGFMAGSHELERLLGGVNTAVLLTSSTTMAIAVERARQRRWPSVERYLLLTAALGTSFVGIKLYEWFMDYQKGLIPGPTFSDPDTGKELFFWFYFVMTGLHAVHLTCGVLAVLILAYLLHRRSSTVLSETLGTAEEDEVLEPPSPVEMLGLYWHLVDLIWFFLYPALYLIGGPPR